MVSESVNVKVREETVPAPSAAPSPTMEPERGEAPEVRWLEGTCSRLSLAPEDVLVVSLPFHLQAEQHERIREHLLDLFPGQRILLLDGGAQVGAMRQRTT